MKRQTANSFYPKTFNHDWQALFASAKICWWLSDRHNRSINLSPLNESDALVTVMNWDAWGECAPSIAIIDSESGIGT